MRSRHVAAERRLALAGAAGEVLEIGFGTGLNLPFYPEGRVTALAALEPNPGMTRLAHRGIAEASFPVALVAERAEALPFDAGRFDCVVSTWTLCSIPAPQRALAEVARVLKPGGRFLFLEHGLAERPRVRRWQRRLTPLQRRIADGCHLDRDFGALVEASDLALDRLERYRLDSLPTLASQLYRGEAIRG
jgi:ubiquinone/menaquinone biosynthesis C-methylase UbiE